MSYLEDINQYLPIVVANLIVDYMEPPCNLCHKSHSKCVIEPCSAVCPKEAPACDGCGNTQCVCVNP